jgi:23S rRNA pseudouridine1911/1915/1917 synthase
MKNNGYDYPDRIDRSDEGLTALAFYARSYRHSSEAAWREKFERGEVTLNGSTASPHDVLRRGDLLVYHRPPWEEPAAPADFGTLY